MLEARKLMPPYDVSCKECGQLGLHSFAYWKNANRVKGIHEKHFPNHTVTISNQDDHGTKRMTKEKQLEDLNQVARVAQEHDKSHTEMMAL